MKFKFNVRRELKIVAAIFVVVSVIAFTERRQTDVAIKDLSVKIKNSANNHFLEESDIMDLMQLNMQSLRGASTNRVKLKEIEAKIKKDPFIESAEMYTDLRGNLIVSVELRRPIARIVRNDGPDGYIAEDGTVMPVSDKFTARVMLISGSYVPALLRQTNLNKTVEGAQLITLINNIREDEFWNAQIAQMDIDAKGNITLLPQVGDLRIEFGQPLDDEVKLRKLMILYKEILPRVGWNKYKRVNLEYEGQLVAE
jgi:cell division protein FtsQ